MLDILLAILTFTSMLVLFKYFGQFKINNLQAIIVNYITAGVCGLLQAYFNGSKIEFSEMISSDYTIPALVIGFMFIFIFNLIAFGTQKIGLAITTVANKMSLVIPVFVSIWLFGDKLGIIKVIGVILAVIAIYFSSTEGGKLNFNKKYLWLIFTIFFGQGIADSALKWAQVNAVDDTNTGAFFATTFLFASFMGSLFLLYELISGKSKIKFKNIVAGIMLGLPNYYTLYFFMRALEGGVLESSQIFPIVNMGVITLTAMLGVILFREKLSRTNWTGILLAITSIALITFSSEIISLFT